MTRFVASLACVLPLLGALACGGQLIPVGAGNGGGDGGPPPPPPDLDASACPAPASILEQAACNVESQVSCVSDQVVYDCDGQLLGVESCSCLAGQWFCTGFSVPACVDASLPPPPVDASVCPPPASIAAGAACNVDSRLSCTSDLAVYDCDGHFVGDQPCFCLNGDWSCAGLIVSQCKDAASPPGLGCPDAGSIKQGDPCSNSSQQCQGNPQMCDGAIFYDAFECDNGQWNDVAMTHCGFDGGVDGA